MGERATARSEQRGEQKSGDASTGTVWLALIANGLITVAKLGVGLLSGSAAMLSEGAHSVADTLNEGFLLTALRRSRREPDARHPFGYGKERFFWSLIAAVGIFVAGAGFSFLQAFEAFVGSAGAEESFGLGYVVLGVAFVLETVSWLRAVWQTRKEARERRKGIVQHVRESSDPTVKTVASEDTAALAGILFAFAGLALHQLTGSDRWEGLASLLIGLLLVFVAYALARDAKGLLIGEAADDDTKGRICDLLESFDGVDEVLEVLTMRVGTDQVLVAVRLDFAAHLAAADVEELSSRIDRALHEQIPEVYQVFLDATDKQTRRERRTDAPYPGHEERLAVTPDGQAG